MSRHDPLTVLSGESFSVHDTTFLGQNELASVNGVGQLKVWDLREKCETAAKVMHLEGESSPLYSIDKQLTQPHIVATGSSEGSLCIWDMRQGSFPVTLLSAHASALWEVHFHATASDHLFTCSE